MINMSALSAMTPALNTGGPKLTKPDGERGFGQVLGEQIDHLEKQQDKADQMIVNAAKGQNTDLSEVMIATQKAGLGLALAIQVRNKAVESYQEIMRMQV